MDRYKIIITDSGYVILSALQPETVGGRVEGKAPGNEEEETDE